MRSSSAVLAVGIISCGRGALTQHCLDSLRSVTRTAFHIYLVDNGSRDPETLGRLRVWERESDVTVIRVPENLGPSAARNLILERVVDQYQKIAFLDNDVVVCDGWDSAALAALDAGFDAVQPKILQPDGITVDRGPTRTRPEPWLMNPEYLHRGVARHAAEVSQRMIVPVTGVAAVVRSALYREVGGYDPRIWVGEDYELSLRAVRKGFRTCYEPRCEMIHDHAYDPAYDAVRSDIVRQLTSHLVLWDLHHKLSLSPYVLHFLLHLYLRGDPLFLPGDSKWSPSGIARRVERRMRQRVFRLRYSDVWKSAAAGARATEELRAALSSAPAGEAPRYAVAGN
jgi:GT2 family glycosyltransferase